MRALITGASSGIGEEMSYYLSELGYDLILVAKTTKKLEKVKNNCKTNVEIIDIDLSKIDNVFKLYNKVKNENIDILINNAGFGLFGHFVETDLEREIEMINLNIAALHILTKKFLQYFKKKKSGYILNVASSAGFMAGPKLGTYYATKNYVLRLTEAIYEELKIEKSNIHISVLCPGPVDTNFNRVAGGKFRIKGANKKYVAKYAIDKMFKNKLIIIPTLKMKLVIFFSKFIPEKLLLRITYGIQDRKS